MYVRETGLRSLEKIRGFRGNFQFSLLLPFSYLDSCNFCHLANSSDLKTAICQFSLLSGDSYCEMLVIATVTVFVVVFLIEV